MATEAVTLDMVDSDLESQFITGPKGGKGLHRIQEVRLREGVTLRTVARKTGLDIHVLRRQEMPSTDLTLSQIRQWADALEVPVTEIISENDDCCLSQSVLQRARMIKVMKTARTLLEKASNGPVKKLSERLVEQLTEVMPELKEVSAWPSVGQRRTVEELGRAADYQGSLDHLVGNAV